MSVDLDEIMEEARTKLPHQKVPFFMTQKIETLDSPLVKDFKEE